MNKPFGSQESFTKLVGSFTLFALFYFSYLYFFDFKEGVSAAPTLIKAFKDFLFLAFVVAIILLVSRSGKQPSRLLTSITFCPFASALTLVSFIHAPQTGLSVQLWENIKNVAIFIPLFSLPFLLSQETRTAIIRTLFKCILFSAIIQSVFSIVYHRLGNQLWLDGVYSGMIGNPNSFALLLNLAAAIILSGLGTVNGLFFFLTLVGFGLLTYTILGTNSGSQSAIFVALLVHGFVLARHEWKKLVAVIIVCSLVAILSTEQVNSTLYTLKGFLPALFGINTPLNPGQKNLSLSVSNRLIDLRDASSVLQGNLPTLLFGSFDNHSYRSMDGQFWLFLYNGGLLVLFSFSAGLLFVYFRSLFLAWNGSARYALALHLMVVVFGVSFIASRVLMYFPFNFLFFLIAGLALSPNPDTQEIQTPNPGTNTLKSSIF